MDWEIKSEREMKGFFVALDALKSMSTLAVNMEASIDDRAPLSGFARMALGLESIMMTRDSLRSAGHPLAKLAPVSLMGSDTNWRMFMAFCSALPYTRSLEALTIDLTPLIDNATWTLSTFAASWLGYAILHPKTKESRLRTLSH